MAQRKDIVIGQGETFTYDLTLKDKQGTPVDLTGHTVTMQVMTNVGESVGDYEATVDDEGNIFFKVTDEVTADWPLGNCRYLIIHDHPNGDKKWLVYGSLTVKSVMN